MKHLNSWIKLVLALMPCCFLAINALLLCASCSSSNEKQLAVSDNVVKTNPKQALAL